MSGYFLTGISWAPSAVRNMRKHIKSLRSSQSPWEHGQESAKGHYQSAHKEGAVRVQNERFSGTEPPQLKVLLSPHGPVFIPESEHPKEGWEVRVPCDWGCSSRDKGQRHHAVQGQDMWLQIFLHPLNKWWWNTYSMTGTVLGTWNRTGKASGSLNPSGGDSQQLHKPEN